jgi:hypothetical protein
MGGVAGVEIQAPIKPEFRTVLSDDALALVARLHRAFEPRRRELLGRRAQRAQRLDAGERPDFPAETRQVREGAWTIAPIPADLQRRRVEITGPVERKMIINALNSGADLYMADFEDSNTPNWDNQIQGQVNLIDAVRRRIEFLNPDGRTYRLNERIATLMVRRAAGTWKRSTCGSTASASRAASSTSRCSCSTTRASWSSAAAGRTSICRSSSRTWKPGCGTTSSCWLRRSWASPRERSRPRC